VSDRRRSGEGNGHVGVHQPDLSIIVPAYNEERRLGATLERIGTYLSDCGISAEIIVVDDGSTDATCEVALGIAERLALPLQLLRNDGNRGKGCSVRQGALGSAGRLVLFSDADLSTPIEEFERLRAPIEAGDADIAIASRGMPESKLAVRQPFWRESMGRVFNRIVRTLALGGFSDTQCGFKLFTRAAADAVFPRQTLDGFAFDVEVLVIARRLGFRIAEVPVTWIDSRASKVSPGGDAARMLRDVLKVRANARRGLYDRPLGRPPDSPDR